MPTFPGLQKHRGIDYQPERDDEPIHELLLKPVKPLPVEQLEKLFLLIERKQQQPQFTPPPEDKVVWQVLHKYLNEKRYIPDYISQGLHDAQLLYMDEQQNIMFLVIRAVQTELVAEVRSTHAVFGTGRMISG